MITRFDDRRVVAKFLKSGVSDKVPEGSALSFEITEFPFNTVQDGWKETHMSKTSSIRPAVSIEHRLVTDGHRPMASTADA